MSNRYKDKYHIREEQKKSTAVDWFHVTENKNSLSSCGMYVHTLYLVSILIELLLERQHLFIFYERQTDILFNWMHHKEHVIKK